MSLRILCVIFLLCLYELIWEFVCPSQVLDNWGSVSSSTCLVKVTCAGPILFSPVTVHILDTTLLISYPEMLHWPHFWKKLWYYTNAFVILALENRVWSKKVQFFGAFRIFCCDAFLHGRRKISGLLLILKRFTWNASGIIPICLITWCFSGWFYFFTNIPHWELFYFLISVHFIYSLTDFSSSLDYLF